MRKHESIKYQRMKVENYLKRYKHIFKLRAIEREVNFPIGKIQKFINEGRVIEDDRIRILYNFLKKSRFK